jgi:hypothetical protein
MIGSLEFYRNVVEVAECLPESDLIEHLMLEPVARQHGCGYDRSHAPVFGRWISLNLFTTFNVYEAPLVGS